MEPLGQARGTYIILLRPALLKLRRASEESVLLRRSRGAESHRSRKFAFIVGQTLGLLRRRIDFVTPVTDASPLDGVSSLSSHGGFVLNAQLVDKNSLSLVLEKSDKRILKDAEDLARALKKLRFEGRQHLAKNAARTYSALVILKERLFSHIQEEEDILFPFFLRTLPRLEPVQYLLFAEHKEFRDKVKDVLTQLKRLGSDRQAAANGALIHRTYSEGIYLTCLVVSHMKVKSHRLYKTIENELKADEKRKLLNLLTL